MSGRLICYARGDALEVVSRVEQLAADLPDITIVCIQLATTPTVRSAFAHAVERHGNLQTRVLDDDLGSGAAYRSGFVANTDDLVGFLSLDGVVDAATIRSFFEGLEAAPHVDALVGNRWAAASTTADPTRRLLSAAFNGFARALFGLRVHDVQAPLKVVRATVLTSVFADLRLTNLGFDAELLSAIERGGFHVLERALAWRATGYGFPIVSTAANVVAALLSLRLLRSPLARLPFVDLIGRRYAIPVKSVYDILLFCWRDPRNPQAGGGEVYLHEQAKHWVRQGHRVTWFAQRFAGAPRREIVDGITVIRHGQFPFVFVTGALWYVFRSPKTYDFIIDCMNGIPFFTPLFSTKPKVCLVYHVHSHHFREELSWPLSSIAIWIETTLVPLVYRQTRFLTISPSTRDEMMRLQMSPHPIDIIESGVPRELVPGRKAEKPTVLYLGRLKAYKRVRDLIDIFRRLRAEFPSAELIIAGDGDDREPLQAYARAAGDDGITFLGRVDDATKLRCMQEAWVFGMPSSVEGWGIVVIEANACGTPAVAYDVAGLRDSIVDGKTGLLAADDAAFERHLRSIIVDADVRERLSAGAIAWAAQFSWDRTAEITLDQIRRAQRWRAVFEQDDGESWTLRVNSRESPTPSPR